MNTVREGESTQATFRSATEKRSPSRYGVNARTSSRTARAGPTRCSASRATASSRSASGSRNLCRRSVSSGASRSKMAQWVQLQARASSWGLVG